MKIFTHSKRKFSKGRDLGFSLVVTVVFVILLSLLSLGLLSLSSITLRSNQSGMNEAQARSNARLALALAIGDLQKYAGPDARATASSQFAGDGRTLRHVAGVWESTQRNPETVTSSDYDDDYQEDFFLSWVMSHPDEEEKTNPSLSIDSLPTVPLVGEGTLGSLANIQDQVVAPKVPLINGETGEVEGNYAFVALDEGVKARIDQGFLPYGNREGTASANLGTSRRNNLSNTSTFSDSRAESFDLSDEGNASELSRVLSLKNAELATSTLAANPQELRAGFHNFSNASESVLSNQAEGGLKLDLTTLFSPAELPRGLPDTSVYESFFGITENPAAPLWGQLHGYSRIYQDLLSGTSAQPSVEMSTPNGWRAGEKEENELGGQEGFTHNAILQQPTGALLLPTIAKVQVFYSLVARDIFDYRQGTDPGAGERTQLHSPWGNRYRNSDYDYLMHLMVTPVITLHNPYNVTLNCENLRAEFINVPMAVQTFRDGIAQVSEPVPVGRMVARIEQGAGDGSAQKRFGMTLGEAPNFQVTLQPGEAKVFSPSIPPSHTWEAEIRARGQFFFDFRSEVGGSGDVDTSRIATVEGWTGPGIGFDLDWFCPDDLRLVNSDVGTDGQNINRTGILAVRPDDEIYIQYAPLGDEALNSKFSVALFDDADQSASTSEISSNPLAIYEFDYQSPEGLRTALLGRNQLRRFPEDASTSLTARDIFEHASVPLRDYVNVGTFACMTASTKTSFGDENGNNDEGRYATKPWLFSNPVSPISQQDFALDHPSHHSYDLNMLTYTDTSEILEKYLEVDPDTNRGLHTTGNTSFRGVDLATHYEIPLAPLQSLPSLNSANLGASGHLPRFDYPIGNSFAHPILNSAGVRQPRGATYELNDHSYYLNSGFFDRSYFSTFADRRTNFLDGISRDDIVTDFLDGQNRSLEQRLSPYIPNGFTSSEAQGAMMDLSDSLLPWKMGAFQMLNGGFNVNSLSVEAWMAVLSGLNPSDANIYRYEPSSRSYEIQELSGSEKGATFSRFRLPNDEDPGASGSVASTIWQGTCQINQDQLRELAEAIVEQVRQRGPFLSMADFLNRELGEGSDDRNLKGALQAAIDQTSINELNPDAGYQIDSGQLVDYQLETPESLVGNSSSGAPGFLTQADLVTVLGNAATTRSDTFRIRAYGESVDRSGRVLATAWCEAIVQRVPEYVDSADEPWAIPTPSRDGSSAAMRMSQGQLPTLQQDVNETFGRSFVIKSFRWLASNEV